MAKRALHIILALLVSVCFMLNGVAHEFVHSFVGHTDTVDRVVTSQANKYSFEPAHLHCKMLDATQPVFFVPLVLALIFAAACSYNRFKGSIYFSYKIKLLFSSFLRGPPACLQLV
ncbi:MAG: hypothetical protein QM642_04870 [Edaphocola sp.]